MARRKLSDKFKNKNFSKKKIILFFVALFFFFCTYVLLKKPSHERNWELGQERTPKIEIDGRLIKVSNFRDFYWDDEGKAFPKYDEAFYDLDKIRSVDVFISHFSDFEGMAHIFLSFGFSDGKHLVVSVETRRETGETFSAIKGLFRKFEIIYVVGSERDIVGVRTGPRNERVYLYPTIASPEKAKSLFLEIAQDVNGVYQEPKFYNTLFNNCTNLITRRVEDISDYEFPLTYKTILPGYFDEVLYDMGLIVKKGSFEETKKSSLVRNSAANRKDANFENALRLK